MEPFWITVWAVLVPGILWASWIDYSQRRVPNWLNAALLVAGFVAQGIFNGWGGVQAAFGGMFVGFGVLILPWCMHAMGAGDVKLMAAIGAWLGPWMTLYSFAVGVAVGGVVAVLMIICSGRAKKAWANIQIIMFKFSNPKTAFSDYGSAKSFGDSSQLLPYGVPLTIGTLIVLGGQFV
ncbi:MAG: prepilin peptidase [Planctomycetes bacterium]|nr:prepilin peptidase [Planctomycetota bacterium]